MDVDPLSFLSFSELNDDALFVVVYVSEHDSMVLDASGPYGCVQDAIEAAELDMEILSDLHPSMARLGLSRSNGHGIITRVAELSPGLKTLEVIRHNGNTNHHPQ